MPIVDQIDCPHCGTKNSGFATAGVFRRKSSQIRASGGGQKYLHEDWVLMSCGDCRKTISVVYTFSHVGKQFEPDKWLREHGNPSHFGFQYKEHFPSASAIKTPDYVPEKVAIPFEQALVNLASSNHDAAGTMARKTLELTTKDMVRNNIEPQDEQNKLITKTWLKNRIEELYRRGLLTDGLRELANLIKDEGNDAAHEEEPFDEQSAKELIEYAEALLTYVYTIPGMVKRVKEMSNTEPETTETEVSTIPDGQQTQSQ